MMDRKKKLGSRCTANRASDVELGMSDARTITNNNSTRKTCICLDGADGSCSPVIGGRDLQTLQALAERGMSRLSSLEFPALRLAAYVFNLREFGLDIETIREKHDGPFPGWHGRYVLHSQVKIAGGNHGSD